MKFLGIKIVLENCEVIFIEDKNIEAFSFSDAPTDYYLSHERKGRKIDYRENHDNIFMIFKPEGIYKGFYDITIVERLFKFKDIAYLELVYDDETKNRKVNVPYLSDAYYTEGDNEYQFAYFEEEKNLMNISITSKSKAKDYPNFEDFFSFYELVHHVKFKTPVNQIIQ